MELTYSGYLQVDKLLSLQDLRSYEPANDELLFIIIHQAYELWFKQVLHEIDQLIHLLGAGDISRIPHKLKRIRTIFKVLAHQWDILETMTPDDFLRFRTKLGTASGFQSFQFRELEFVLGYKRNQMLSIFKDDPPAHKRLTHRLSQPSLWDAFLIFLDSAGYPIPQNRLGKTTDTPTEPNADIQDVLLRIYRDNLTLRDICESLVDIDEGIQEWRYHHVKMVERTLGGKPGTGGSSGTDYLRKTLFKPFFPDLWAIRSQFVDANES
ncbi:MAG: tryptophan 2,3-dioxygenase [Desulfobacteraceae bacterium]|nr:tryptophan 2,3-dioxygenase [Desulfobacteraceae bacterium]